MGGALGICDAPAAGVEGEAACPAAVDGAVPLGDDDPQAATRIAATMTEERDSLTIGVVNLRGYPSFHKPVRLAGMRAGLPSA